MRCNKTLDCIEVMDFGGEILGPRIWEHEEEISGGNFSDYIPGEFPFVFLIKGREEENRRLEVGGSAYVAAVAMALEAQRLLEK